MKKASHLQSAMGEKIENDGEFHSKSVSIWNMEEKDFPLILWPFRSVHIFLMIPKSEQVLSHLRHVALDIGLKVSAQGSPYIFLYAIMWSEVTIFRRFDLLASRAISVTASIMAFLWALLKISFSTS